MANIPISKVDIVRDINGVLAEFSNSVDEAVDEAVKETAKEAVKRLKSTSPKGSTGKYAKGWTSTTEGGKKYYKVTVHNKQYQLTHLLENGHNKVVKGQVVGYVAARPHIAAVEQFVQEDVEQRLRAKIEE